MTQLHSDIKTETNLSSKIKALADRKPDTSAIFRDVGQLSDRKSDVNSKPETKKLAGPSSKDAENIFKNISPTMNMFRDEIRKVYGRLFMNLMNIMLLEDESSRPIMADIAEIIKKSNWFNIIYQTKEANDIVRFGINCSDCGCFVNYFKKSVSSNIQHNSSFGTKHIKQTKHIKHTKNSKHTQQNE